VEGNRYSIEFVPGAVRQLQKLARAAQRRLGVTIGRLAVEPRPPGAKLLSGGEGIWRIRVGDSRVLYRIQDGRVLVLVIRVGHRRDVYRGQSQP
jgi:mRNA interferase RelE/StbE